MSITHPPRPHRRPESGGNPETVNPPMGRRERLRKEATEEILETARGLLESAPDGGFSLRAVARGMGMAPSAIYRYFDSRQALAQALAEEACRRALGEFEQALAGATSHRERVERLAASYRSWALRHPAEYSLIVGVNQPGDDDADHSPHVLNRLLLLPLRDVCVAAAREGKLNLRRTEQMPTELRLAAPAQTWLDLGEDLDARYAGLLVAATAALHGIVSSELFGHAGDVIDEPELLFDVYVKLTLDSLGFTD
ncbi:TetR/AcrR family transcriptional regulator [Nocardioides limicola]|uniref:TetR/AcrR family transcriptional regulator n=1 Tax=Nocardioides limicola TaxID=2803368 RepID=UPI00193C407E|nr:TetR/AcrR family transcriptional regulator [Nocardioides sp. DJM-14]